MYIDLPETSTVLARFEYPKKLTFYSQNMGVANLNFLLFMRPQMLFADKRKAHIFQKIGIDFGMIKTSASGQIAARLFFQLSKDFQLKTFENNDCLLA